MKSFNQALSVMKMAFWLVSIVMIFNFYSDVKQFQTDVPQSYRRFEFWCHVEMMCFSMNIVAFIVHGFMRFFEGGSFINKDAQQHEDFLKSALEGGLASWLAVEASVTATLAFTYWLSSQEGQDDSVQKVLKWWLPVSGVMLLLVPVTHLLMERATYFLGSKEDIKVMFQIAVFSTLALLILGPIYLPCLIPCALCECF